MYNIKNNMKTYKVYEIYNSLGTVEYVGETGNRIEGRLYDHTRRKPTQSGRGKFYGRTDLFIHLVAEFDNRKEALALEGVLKKEYGLEWTELTMRTRNGVESHRSGKLKEIQARAQIKIECIHCGTIANKLNHGKWHGDKCKKRHEI